MRAACMTGQAMGITVLDVTGVEADDVIGTYATRALQQDMAVVIVSPDKVLCLPLYCSLLTIPLHSLP